MKKVLLLLACISLFAFSCKQKTVQQDLETPNAVESEIEADNMQYCQSCTMPLTEDLYGTNADGSLNEDYCKYCYSNGAFTAPDMTMERMIEICVPYMVEQGMEEASARYLLEEYLPKLKRWQTEE